MGINQSLHCFSSGVVADETVNVNTAQEKRENRCVEDFTFRKKSQAATLNCKTQVKINNDSVAVDPHLLFQRLVSVAKGNTMYQTTGTLNFVHI